MATVFLAKLVALALGNAVFLAAGFLDEVIFWGLGDVVCLILCDVCFCVPLDFLLVGLEFLVIVFWDFSVLDLERLFFDIANLLNIWSR